MCTYSLAFSYAEDDTRTHTHNLTHCMIIQVANIVSGFALAAPKLGESIGREHIEKAHRGLAPYLTTIGRIELVLGLIALIDRMGLVSLPFLNLGSSYPQAIPAILMGLVLAGPTWMRIPTLARIVTSLEPHRAILGYIGIAVGLGSLLFGCVLCSFWYL